MCFFTGLILTKPKKIKLLNDQKTLDPTNVNCFNGFERPFTPLIKANNESNKIEIINASWTFIPNWINSLHKLNEHVKNYNTLNAKAESLFSSKMYQQSILNNRCIIPVTHFFEWQHFKPLGSKKANTYPYTIHSKIGLENELLYIAAIYNKAIDFVNNKTFISYAIITTQANSLMCKIHNTKQRMPTILTEDLASIWLSNISEKEINDLVHYRIDSLDLNAFTINRNFKESNSINKVFYPELEMNTLQLF